ncbi:MULTISPECIES: DUF2007 domain-containing protein [unclassified Bizionia]|uniref:putative signal transducing protein n=1 Tax=unclassified Bizionia TaxID=2626393 RepID=UPI002059FB0F|nr:DUF2007 domain-containing protein [Bizionia sp. M204]UPS90267.1 DUF2007 domain-containing protein [Bizionia sp. M204]
MSRKLILSSNSQVQVSGVKNALDEAQIAYFEINKSDSSYPGILGQIEIHVHDADEAKALLVIKDLVNN